MITSNMAVVYAYTIFLIGKRDFKLNHEELRNIIARWFFMASLTSRYASSPESQMEQDLARLRSVKNSKEFIQSLEQIITDNLTDDFWNINLPNERLATSAARSPSLFAYMAALNILDAKALFSNIKVSNLLDPSIKSKRSSIERHHLFPKEYLESIGIKENTKINQIANYVLIEWLDNSDISSLSPSEYFPKYKNHMSEDMYFWHALPKQWETMGYEDFITERRKLIAKVIRTGFERLSKLSEEEGGEEQLPNNYSEWSLETCLQKGESDLIEFKSSMIWDYKNNKPSEELQLMITKTLSAFMNSYGGVLIVGIDDDANLLGLENDMSIFSERKNWDGWLQHLVNLIRKQIGPEYLNYIVTEKFTKEGKTIAKIVVKPSNKPTFVEYRDKNGQSKTDFFVRGLNTTQSLNNRQTADYIKNHW
jgi:hypothetical protein